MLDIVATSEFRTADKKMRKQKKDVTLFDEVLEKLVKNLPLDPAYKNHPLKGYHPVIWELHIRPDWILFYRIDKKKNQLQLITMGSHSDLLRKKKR